MLKSLKKAVCVTISSLLFSSMIPACTKHVLLETSNVPVKTYKISNKLGENKYPLSEYKIDNINRLDRHIEFGVYESKYNITDERYNVQEMTDSQEVSRYMDKKVNYTWKEVGGTLLAGGLLGGIAALCSTGGASKEEGADPGAVGLVAGSVGLSIGVILSLWPKKGEPYEKADNTKTEITNQITEIRQRKDPIYLDKPVENVSVSIGSSWFAVPEKVNTGKNGSAQFSFKLPNNFYIKNPEDAQIIKELRKKGVQEIYIKSLAEIGTSERTATINLETVVKDAKNATETINIDGHEINCDMVAEISNIPCGPE